MAQTTTGVHSVLNHPFVYTLFQRLMGARAGWARLAHEYMRARPGDKVLDIGCGPADVLDHLPNVQYWGFDISQDYIDRARRRFGNRGTFTARYFTPADVAALPPADVVLASGVLHHMNDEEAAELFRLARLALRPGGRLVSVDPCYVPGQNMLARFLIDHDRGRNVRSEAGYKALAQSAFGEVRTSVRHQTWIPYTHCYMECTKT